MFRELIRSAASRIRGRNEDSLEPMPRELTPVVELISAVHAPPEGFVESLGARLAGLEVNYGPRRERSGWLKRPAVRMAGALGVLAVVAMVLAMLMTADGPTEPGLVSADVIARSLDRLLDLETVRYEIETTVDHSICFTGYNTSLDAGERASLGGQFSESQMDAAIVYGCPEGEQRHVETGAYDLANQAFRGELRRSDSLPGVKLFDEDGNLIGSQVTERIFVGGELFYRDCPGGWEADPASAGRLLAGEQGSGCDSEWMPQPTPNIWMPFTFQGTAQVPAGDLQALRSSYDEVVKVGEDSVDGVRVVHYRASRVGPAGPESAEVWIGAEDGLPRRAVVTLEMENSEASHLQRISENLRSDPVFAEYADSPVVRRGEWSEKSTITYGYTLWDFNEPVSIEAPR